MTATTKFQNRLLNQTKTLRKKPYRAWAWRVPAGKIRQETLDTEGSFRGQNLNMGGNVPIVGTRSQSPKSAGKCGRTGSFTRET